MSIQGRVEDAEFLWCHGRLEGAFLSVLTAVAATSRLRYPDRETIKDGEAFRRFIASAHTVRLRVEFRGELFSIEQVFYKWLRCELVHEGGLPVDIKFLPEDSLELSVRAGGKPEYILKLSRGWFYHLIQAVKTAPENSRRFKL